jgi:hypothetical protein
MFDPSDFEEDFKNCHPVILFAIVLSVNSIIFNLTSSIGLLFRWAASATQTQLLSMV